MVCDDTDEFITVRNAIKKYKINERDIYDYCINNKDVVCYKNAKSTKYLISDIEKIATLKHNTIDGKRFMKILKRTDQIYDELTKLENYLWDDEFGHDIDIYELENMLSNNDDLDVIEVMDKVYADFKKKEKLDKIIDTLIFDTVCQIKMVSELSGVTYDDLKNLKITPNQIFNELIYTETYKNLKYNFNYDIFNEITILKVSFIDVFTNDIKYIIKRKDNNHNQSLKNNEFKNLVEITVGSRLKCKKYFSEYDAIKDYFLCGNMTQSEAYDLLNDLNDKIKNKTNENIEVFKSLFGVKFSSLNGFLNMSVNGLLDDKFSF